MSCSNGQKGMKVQQETWKPVLREEQSVVQAQAQSGQTRKQFGKGGVVEAQGGGGDILVDPWLP